MFVVSFDVAFLKAICNENQTKRLDIKHSLSCFALEVGTDGKFR